MGIEAAKLWVTVGADTREGEQGLTSFNNKMNNAARGMTMTGAALTAGVTLPLLAIGKAALDSAMGFEQNMNVLQQVSGASADTMSALSAEALRLGAVTSFSAGEAAEGMLELAKAGMSTEEIMASIGGVMDLAAAGGIGLAEAASITAAALNAFHLEASESGRVANLLAAAANASAASISDLSQGMQQAGFAFSMANQPIDYLAASLAILTNVGLTGSDAGTALKNAFMRMMNPTAEASALMQELNINFYDAAGNMKALPDIIDMLNVATGGLTDEQRDAALSTIFLSDGMKAMIPLMDAGKGGFNEMLIAVNQMGAATEVAGARMKGAAGGLEYLSGSVDSFMIGAALPFMGAVGDLARGAGDLLTQFGALPTPIINATLAFAGILAAIGPVLLILGGLTAALVSPLLPIALLVVGVAALSAAWIANVGGIQEITATALAPVQAWFASTLTAATDLATGIQTAFTNTKFPSLESLWTDFKAGAFETLATKIRSAAFDLMVNLDTELNITGAVKSIPVNAGKLRDDILTGLSTAIDGVDWAGGGTTFAGMISDLTASVQGLDFSGIDWAVVFQRILLGPMGVAISALQWVIGADSFKGLQTSVGSAIAGVPWTDLTVETGGLTTAVGAQIGSVLADMFSDLSAHIPAISIDWSAFTFDAAGMINRLTVSIATVDWSKMGQKVGELLVDAVMLALGVSALIKRAEGSFQVWVGNLAISVGSALASYTWGDLATSLMALDTMIDGAVTQFMTGIFAGIGAEGSKIEFKLPGWVTDLMAWRPDVPGWVASLLSLFGIEDGSQRFEPTQGPSPILSQQNPLDLTSQVPTFAWSDYVSAVTWTSFVPDITWPDFVPSISWGSFVPDIDWTDFIPSFLGGGGGGSSEPQAQGSSLGGTRFALAGGGGGNVHIHVNATISNDFDLEVLASKLATRFKQKMR